MCTFYKPTTPKILFPPLLSTVARMRKQKDWVRLGSKKFVLFPHHTQHLFLFSSIWNIATKQCQKQSWHFFKHWLRLWHSMKMRCQPGMLRPIGAKGVRYRERLQAEQGAQTRACRSSGKCRSAWFPQTSTISSAMLDQQTLHDHAFASAMFACS